MALSPPPNLLQFPLRSPYLSAQYLLISGHTLFRSSWISPQISTSLSPLTITVRDLPKFKCFTKSTEEGRLIFSEPLSSDVDEDEDYRTVELKSVTTTVPDNTPRSPTSSSDSPSLGLREQFYEVSQYVICFHHKCNESGSFEISLQLASL